MLLQFFSLALARCLDLLVDKKLALESNVTSLQGQLASIVHRPSPSLLADSHFLMTVLV
jgi:hypothetical protein